MAVHIRLKRMGRRKRPFYRVVVMDSKTRRDGAPIERLGWFDPLVQDNSIKINEERTIHWLKLGAKPTDTVHGLMKTVGIAMKWHLIRAGKSENEIDIAMKEWHDSKSLKADEIVKAKMLKAEAEKKVLEEAEAKKAEELKLAEEAEKATEEVVETEETPAEDNSEDTK